MCNINKGQGMYLCVGIVSRLETQVLKAHVGKEVAEEALETFEVSVKGIVCGEMMGRTYHLM